MVFNPGEAALGNALILLMPINCADLPGNCNTDAYYINPIKRYTYMLISEKPTQLFDMFIYFEGLYLYLSISDQKLFLDPSLD